jgi:superfamily II DNA or RNA helicase
MIRRYSSRRAPLAHLIRELLDGASSYDRIAGYFSSSILEVAGEELEAMQWKDGDPPTIRVICNSSLDPSDVETAKAAQWAMWREWCAQLPADLNDEAKNRLQRLHEFLQSGRLDVRVLPDKVFGLVHGKAGVIRRADKSPVGFVGSANESKTAWTMNYELVWVDESSEGVEWIEEEFNALWAHPLARPLADSIVADIDRLSKRTSFASIQDWKKDPKPDPASPIVELPVYRRENGLWAHQKYFINLAFNAHRAGGARYVLADQVGLGKTVQLGLAAKLMALVGDKPVLILVPKTLMEQWQAELWDLLAMPSARWTGRQWIDERGVVHADLGIDGIVKCPRRVGIVSSGLVTSGSPAVPKLLLLKYECVIVDEAHRARRNSGTSATVSYNNLMRFIRSISLRTKSLMMGTATPVQLNPIEAFDLLDALAQNDDRVLGSRFSFWRTQAQTSLDMIVGTQPAPKTLDITWPWMCNPLPSEKENSDFARIRKALGVKPSAAKCEVDDIRKLGPVDERIASGLAKKFFPQHNPYIRHIVRRTREYLENAVDPATGETYLKPVRVRLFGEGDTDALTLPPYLKDAYDAGDEFCMELGKRPGLNSGFLKTILLRRIGSSIVAGLNTGLKMLGPDLEEIDAEEDEGSEDLPATTSSLAPFSEPELALLRRFVQMLQTNTMEDPKYAEIERTLLTGLLDPQIGETGPWLERGCILFSQFYDTAHWVAERLAKKLPDEPIAIYAGSGRSAILKGDTYERIERERIKTMVRTGEIRLVVGTDAASEGLNLQRLGTLINIDLPWNPTRLEQRKGRIQRIGQLREEIFVLNLRYRDSVEDRVHHLLAARQQTIHALFGQIPDTLEDVWVLVARHDETEAQKRIDLVPSVHPFELRYERIPEQVDFESCVRVLATRDQVEELMNEW